MTPFLLFFVPVRRISNDHTLLYDRVGLGAAHQPRKATWVARPPSLRVRTGAGTRLEREGRCARWDPDALVSCHFGVLPATWPAARSELGRRLDRPLVAISLIRDPPTDAIIAETCHPIASQIVPRRNRAGRPRPASPSTCPCDRAVQSTQHIFEDWERVAVSPAAGPVTPLWARRRG